VSACYDCAVCTGRMEMSRGMGRDAAEIATLSRQCPSCRHALHRHLHGALRAAGGEVTEDRLPADRPSRDSALGVALLEMGEYDNYFETLRRDPPS